MKRFIIPATALIFAVIFSCQSAVKTVAQNAENGIFVPIIMYHSVKKSNISGDYIVSVETLENDMKYLDENGYTAVFVSELADYVYDNIPLPEKPVVITFDDGQLNNMEYVLPLLKKYNMKAVFSVVGAYTERYSENPDRSLAYAYLTWEDIAALAQSGYVEIGNHSYDLHNLGARRGCLIKQCESCDDYSAVMHGDIEKLQNELTEKSGVTPVTFTYPFGLICAESLLLIKEMGFKAALSCFEKPNYITKNPDCLFGLNRYNRTNWISTEEFMEKALKG